MIGWGEWIEALPRALKDKGYVRCNARRCARPSIFSPLSFTALSTVDSHSNRKTGMLEEHDRGCKVIGLVQRAVRVVHGELDLGADFVPVAPVVAESAQELEFITVGDSLVFWGSSERFDALASLGRSVGG